MSDAAYDVALGVLRGFTMGEEVGSQALAVVESQNQALQEEVAMWKDATAGEQQRHIATQERAEKAEAVLETLVVAHAADLPASHDAALTLARDYLNALSPTQETDPE